MELTIFGTAEETVTQQIQNCATGADYAVLCADNHLGYSQPIGAAVAYEHHISPSGVGFDIACGNLAAKTNLQADYENIPLLMDEIVRRISFGVGGKNHERFDHEVLTDIANAPFEPQRALLDLAAEQLGTVGSGNHYVDLFRDEEGWLWVGVHFGSRGFGHKTATGFIALAQGKKFGDKASEGGMMSPPILLDTRTDLGQAYVEAMTLAGKYAYAGREAVVAKVLQILGAKAVSEVHNHHNFAWKEPHFGKDYWVVRKGCTPAFPGQKGFVGATMSGTSVILEGVESDLSAKALYSTVHGAGRVMSRSQAAGKMKWVKGEDGKKRPQRLSGGLVDWEAAQARLRKQGVELRGGGADEAPEAYKNLDDVLAFHGETVRVLHRLEPIGVAMAGSDVYDPYQD